MQFIDFQTFCKSVQSGEGRIFECLMQHRNQEEMTGEASYFHLLFSRRVFSFIYEVWHEGRR